MSGGVVVIGIGNSFRRDDGVGPAVCTDIAERELPGVQVLTTIGEPTAILDAWTGAALAVVVDAAVSDSSTPGRVRRCGPDDWAGGTALSSHGWGIPQVLALGQTVGCVPDELVVFTVDAADTCHGVGLTADVADAVPEAVAAVLDELRRRDWLSAGY